MPRGLWFVQHADLLEAPAPLQESGRRPLSEVRGGVARQVRREAAEEAEGRQSRSEEAKPHRSGVSGRVAGLLRKE